MIWLVFVSCQSQSMLEDSASENHILCEDPPLYEEWTEGFLRGKCQPCHAVNSPNRYGAPENVYFDSEAASLFWIDAIERTTLSAESMPPSGGVTADEKELLQRWIECN